MLNSYNILTVSKYMIEPQECIAYEGNDKEASAEDSKHETLWKK